MGALHQMSEMECAEMIEQHIDYYTENKDGDRRSVHLPTQFVRHYHAAATTTCCR